MTFNQGPNIGDLSRRIEIIRNTSSSKNGVGEVVLNWTTVANVWASYTPVSDAEKVLANEVYASLACRFVIRWSSDVADVDPRDRINFDGRVFDIAGVKEIERRRWLEITAGTRGERT